MPRAKVLLDTDIGSDIDDALCLAYLLAQPACELLGITTVSGQPQRRAMLADAICRAAGRVDVPIHSGSAEPLRVAQRQPSVPQAEILDRWPHRSDFPADTAVDFIIDTLRSHPGEVTLLAIGPLTNLARAVQRDPQILRYPKLLVLMNGNFHTHRAAGDPRGAHAEWNVYCDPHASAIVYDSGAPLVTIGVDVTSRCVVGAESLRRAFEDGQLSIVWEAAQVWLRDRPDVVLHDPLAAGCCFVPELFQVRSARVWVELEPGESEGVTWCSWETLDAAHRVIVDVAYDKFIDHYFDVIRRYAEPRSSMEGDESRAQSAGHQRD